MFPGIVHKWEHNDEKLILVIYAAVSDFFL